MHQNLVRRVIDNALISYRVDIENQPDLDLTNPDDQVIKHYLTTSTDCVIYPHQMPGLVEDFKAELKKQDAAKETKE
jgi:hypothetical protein